MPFFISKFKPYSLKYLSLADCKNQYVETFLYWIIVEFLKKRLQVNLLHSSLSAVFPNSAQWMK